MSVKNYGIIGSLVYAILLIWGLSVYHFGYDNAQVEEKLLETNSCYSKIMIILYILYDFYSVLWYCSMYYSIAIRTSILWILVGAFFVYDVILESYNRKCNIMNNFVIINLILYFGQIIFLHLFIFGKQQYDPIEEKSILNKNRYNLYSDNV
jgi:hypothetical protein